VSSAAYDRQVRAAIQRAGLDGSGQVRFLGPVRDMQGLYAAADVVLLPSRSEASPIAALEALSAGVPLLLSAAANTDTVMLAGRHGWLVEEPSAPSIAAALREMLSTGGDRLRALGAAGREHVLAHFTTTRVAQDFMRLYDTLLAEKSA